AARLPFGTQHPEDVDVVEALAVAVPVAQDALAPEADRLKRCARAQVLGVRVRAEAVHAEHDERDVGDERLGLAVCAGPPEAPAEPRPDDAATVAMGQLAEAGDARGTELAMLDQEVELLAPLALAGAALDVGQRLADRGVRPPREPPRP